MYLVTTNLKGISSMKLHRELDITQKSAWHLAHRIREMWGQEGGEPFVGPIEADETYVGGKVANMHKWQREARGGKRGPVGKTAVVGVKDRKTNQVRAAVLDNATLPFIQGFVTRHRTLDTKLYTDESHAYGKMGNRETVKHSAGEYARSDVSTNGIESFWSMLKRGYVGVFHRMSPEHLHRYVTEFEGRHNARDLDTEKQMGEMVRGAEGRRLTYEQLIGFGCRRRARAV